MNDRAEIIFFRASELPDHERESYLIEACGDELDLREEVDQLLLDAHAAESFFSGSFGGRDFSKPLIKAHMENPGDQIGSYLLIRELGEGGFGVVWEAQQSKPISRRVALKVIKAGMDTDEVLQRFAAERQALARMDHPHIAKVFDAGATPQGRPFFSMELVDGEPITHFCENHGLDTRARLSLFNQACSAINHAHQKGIIHRDVKPSNVLVTRNDLGEPIVKVIDFGIAKAIEGRLTDLTLHTRQEQILGTPAYMSPEQAGLGSVDVDTRSDIYGLGVLLYELIAGVAPFDASTLLNVGYEEMRRIIREVDPPKPSVRIATASANKGAVHSIGTGNYKQVSFELDWIVLKAMEKSKERRYDSVTALSADVGRYLSDEAVLARPPSRFYLISKFIRRHRLGIYTGAAFVLLIIGAAVLSAWLAVRARDAEKIAQERLVTALQDRNEKKLALEEAEAVGKLLTNVFQSPQPGVDGRNVTVIQVLDEAVKKLDEQLASQPQRRVTLKEVLAETYARLGIYDRSFEILKENYEYQKQLTSEQDPLTRKSLRKLVEACEAMGDSQAALDLAKLEMQIHAKCGATPEEIEVTSRSEIRAYFGTGNQPKAVERQRELVRHCLDSFGAESGAYTRANWELRQYEAREQRTGGVQDQATSSGKISKLEQELAQLTQDNGSTHPVTIDKRMAFARALAAAGHTIEALLQLQAIEPVLMKEYGPKDDRTLQAQSLLVQVYVILGRKVEAVRVQQAVVHSLREREGGASPKTIEAEDILERRIFYAKLSNDPMKDEYRAYLQDLLERRIKVLGLDSVDTAMIQMKAESANPEESEKNRKNAIRVMTLNYGENSRSTAEAMAMLARLYVGQGRVDEAMPLYEKCGPNMKDDTWLNFELATFQIWMNDLEGYRETRRFILAYWMKNTKRNISVGDMFDRALWLCSLTDYDDQKQSDDIQTILDHVQSVRDGIKMEAEDRHSVTLQHQLHGIVLFRLKRYQEAMTSFREVERVLKSESYKPNGMDYNLSLPMTYFYMAMTEHRMGNSEEAVKRFDLGESLLRREPPPVQNPKLKHFVGGNALVLWICHREAKRMVKGE
jgi:eukaryotic-like serine/threonine-protein kinase